MALNEHNCLFLKCSKCDIRGNSTLSATDNNELNENASIRLRFKQVRGPRWFIFSHFFFLTVFNYAPDENQLLSRTCMVFVRGFDKIKIHCHSCEHSWELSQWFLKGVFVSENFQILADSRRAFFIFCFKRYKYFFIVTFFLFGGLYKILLLFSSQHVQ